MKIKQVVFFLAGLATSCWVGADVIVQSTVGDVRKEFAGSVSQLVVNEKLDPGVILHTGPNGQVILRFDDGQLTALSANSSFKIDQYRFEAAKPEEGNIAISLLKGALRAVTGLIGQRNRNNFALVTPNATIGIRGTDFMVAIINPVYVSVTEGAISAANTAGTVSFAAGATGMVASATTLATSIAASALPASVSATFSQLGALPMAGAAGAAGASTGAASGAGASGAVSAAAGGLGAGAIAAGALVAGAVAASAGGSSAIGSSTTTTTTTTTQ